MPYKIVILGYSSSVHIIRWAGGLARLDHDVRVISLGGGKIDNIETIIIPAGSNRSIGYLLNSGRVRKLINGIKPDLLHSHFATGFGMWGMQSKFHPHIISVWGADVIDFPNTWLKRKLLGRILHSADRITSTSLFLRQKTVGLFSDLEKNISVIPFGVTVSDIIKRPRNDGLTRLVFIKAHRKKYGPDILIEAVSEAVKSGLNLHLTIAGEGGMTGQLQDQVKRLGLNEYVTFAGFIDNRNMPEFLAEQDIMVMPSVMDSESFGVAVLEASAAGLPVIASRIGGVPEVLRDNETGILVPAGDVASLTTSIIKLAQNSEVQKKMGLAGRKFVEDNYRWDD
ncbi:MAG: glycosyltransferase family 4 protein, partial [Candidatus Zixiibacteriota bacterium]